MNFYEELRRRNVFRVGIAYAVLAWLLAQVADLFMEAFGAPEWALRTLLLLLLLGFPLALFFAWAFELTPEGIKREKEVDRSQSITRKTGRKLDRAIIAVLALALGYFAWDKFSAGNAPGPQSAETGSPGAAEPAPTPPAAALPDDPSIAVLPFENRSQRIEDEYFSSGIHDDLLTQLAQISSLRVISRTSVAQFRDTTLSIREIAQALGVATVLEGGVQRAGNQVRINMQLIDAATDAHLWAQTFDRELTANNVFSIQSEIAGAVTNALRVTLTPDEQRRMREVPTEDLAALELYFKGRAELDQRTLPSIQSARLRFEEARRLDAGFAQAWAGEAQAILLLSDDGTSYGDIPTQEAIAMARPLMEQAYALAPEDPQVLGVYGLLEQTAFEVERALDYYRRSLLANPSSGEVLNWQRMAQWAAGLAEQSLATAARMVEVDPLSKVALFNAAASFVNTPYDDGALVEQLLDRLEGLDRSYGLSARGLVAGRRGRVVDSIRHLYTAIEVDPGRSSTRADLADLLMSLGLVEEAIQVNPRLDEFNAAMGRGDFEQALRLARAQFERDPESRESNGRLMYMLAQATDRPEEAMPLAQGLWELAEETGVSYAPFFLDLARIAQLAEYPAEARRFRDAGAEALRNMLEAGESGGAVQMPSALLAVLDGKNDDAVRALAASIDAGMRRPFLAENRFFAPLRDDLQFQAELARMGELIERERAQVVSMLCGPEKIVSLHQPAPETCALYAAR